MLDISMVLIEGNIGCGKTTLCEKALLLASDRMVIVKEDIDELLLKLFYGDPQKYAMLLQLSTLERRTNAIYSRVLEERMQPFGVGETRSRNVLLDRSLFGDFVFALANYVTGSIDDSEMEVYFHHAGCNHITEIDAVLRKVYHYAPWRLIYLHSSAEECKRRVDEQRRTVEADLVPLSYYQLIEQVYFNLLLALTKRSKNAATVLLWHQYRVTNRTVSRILYGDMYETVPDEAVTLVQVPRKQVADPPANVLPSRLAQVGCVWFDHAYIEKQMHWWSLQKEM